MEDEPTSKLPSFMPPYEILFDPSDIRLVGMPILIKHNATSVRRATANAVYNGKQFGYVTAAHALEEIVAEDKDTDKDEDGMDMPFDSDSDNDEQHDDGERDMLSLHSNTSHESSESGRSSRSPETSPSRGSSLQTNQSHVSLTTSASNQASHQSEPLADAAKDADQALLAVCRTLGNVSFAMTALDYAVITVTDTKVISDLERFKGTSNDPIFTTELAESENSSIVAWSSHGPLHGKLLEAPMTMRLSNSKSYELVYKFTYQSDSMIRMGDCGTLVTDPEGTILFGHVIAISESIRVAYMVASERTVQELERAGQWHFLSVQDDVSRRATTSRSLELVSGSVSLLFQLFASCITGLTRRPRGLTKANF